MVGRQIADLIRRFRQTYPGIELKISELGGLSVEQAVMSGELDLAMTVLPFDSEQPLTFLPLLGHPMCVVAPRTPQWLNRTSINIAELADSPILIYNEDFALYKMLMKAFRRAGFEPHIAVRSANGTSSPRWCRPAWASPCCRSRSAAGWTRKTRSGYRWNRAWSGKSG